MSEKNGYRGTAYWETETPQVVKTGKLLLSYFPQAGRLQISQVYQKDGQDQRGRTVTLDLEDMALHSEAAELIKLALSCE
jgi:tricorn protease-like protein